MPEMAGCRTYQSRGRIPVNISLQVIYCDHGGNIIKGQSTGCGRPTKAGWQPGRLQPEPRPADTPGTPFPPLPTTTSVFEGMSRIDNSLMGNIWNNAGKRQIGKGFIGFLTDAEYRQSRIDANVHRQMVALHDHRYVVILDNEVLSYYDHQLQ